MTTVNTVYEFLKDLAPEEMAEDFDNVGFLVGSGESIVSKILISLDITNDVVTEALCLGADLIVSHHPLFFSLKSVTDHDITGKKIFRMIAGDISAICMHTNLDAAQGGVNDALAVAVGIADNVRKAEPLPDAKVLNSGEVVSYGRVGYLQKACLMADYLQALERSLNANGLRFYDAGRDVYKVAISAGGGGVEWEKVKKSNCDTFITADVKYSLFLEARELGINIIDGGHYCTENLVTDVLASKLKAEFPTTDISVSKMLDETVIFY